MGMPHEPPPTTPRGFADRYISNIPAGKPTVRLIFNHMAAVDPQTAAYSKRAATVKNV
jgi:hypothetical protein